MMVAIFWLVTTYLNLHYWLLFCRSWGPEIAICIPSARGIHFLVSLGFVSSKMKVVSLKGVTFSRYANNFVLLTKIKGTA